MKNYLVLLMLLMIFLTPESYAEVPAEGAAPAFKVNGISYDDANPAQSIIVLDEDVLKRGDSYKGYLITEVYSDHIVLEDNAGKTYELSPGDGSSAPAPGTEKKSWNPLANVSAPPALQGKNVQNWLANKASEAQKAVVHASQGLAKSTSNNSMLHTKDNLTKQLDTIKADRDKRDAELLKYTS